MDRVKKSIKNYSAAVKQHNSLKSIAVRAGITIALLLAASRSGIFFVRRVCRKPISPSFTFYPSF
jgi:hypothetical protein